VYIGAWPPTRKSASKECMSSDASDGVFSTSAACVGLWVNPRLIRSLAEYPDSCRGSEKPSACSAPPSGLAMVTRYPASVKTQ